MNFIIDFDNTIVDSITPIIKMYEKEYGKVNIDIDYSQISWGFNEVCKLWNAEKIAEQFSKKEFFDLVEPLENVIEVLKKLNNKGVNIIIATVHNAKGMKYKSDYIKKILPFVSTIVFVDKNNDNSFLNKSFIYGDLILDDNVDVLNTSICPVKVCYGNYKYNKGWTGDRATNWLDFYNYVHEKFDI